MKMTCRILIALGALVLAGCGSAGSDSPDTENATLSAYKINEVAARSASDPQPYGTKVASIMPWKQIYFDGVTYNGSSEPQYLSFKGNTVGTAVTGSNEDLAKYPHASTSARLGTDGKDSIVSVVFYPDNTSFSAEYTGTVSLVVWNGGTPSVHTPKYDNKTFTIYLCNLGEWTFNRQLNNEISIASGDITGDGKDEIGFCVGNRFVILSGNLSTILYDGWATGSGAEDKDTTTMHPSRVAAGDITGDGSIEFVTTYGSAKTGAVGSYKIFGGSKSPSVIASGSLGGGSCPLSLMYANVCLGDIDGDDLNEAIFAGRQDVTNDFCNVVALDWDTEDSDFSFLTGGYSIPVAGSDWGYNPLPPLAAFQPGPKKQDKSEVNIDILLAWDRILTYSTTSNSFSAGYKGRTTIDRPVNTMTIAGDFNYDNQDELVSFSSLGYLEVFSLGAGNSFTRSTISIDAGNYMSLCPADIDGESLVVQYLGTSVKYTDPQIVAVLASPPYYTDAASNASVGNCATSFGTGKSNDKETSSSFSLNTSVTVGAEADCPLWSMLGKMTVKYTVGASVSGGFSESIENSTMHKYSTMAGSDAVLYTSIPYDVYQYRVLSPVPASEEDALMTVSFPRDAQLVLMDRTLFNALPGNTHSVDSSVLTHTLGTPFSYPNKSTVYGAVNAEGGGGLYDDTGVTSAVGDKQFNDSTVSQTVTKAKTVGTGVSMDASVEYVAFGGIFGADIGFAYDYEYSVSSSQTTEISGTVPGINSSDTPFTYGIAGYQLKDTAIQQDRFLVVTYWVEK